MTPSQSLAVVQSYYDAYRATDVVAALGAVLDADVVIDSPIVRAKFGDAIRGEAAVTAAVSVAPFLKNATVEAYYTSVDDDAVAALIHVPSPVGMISQSEHFDIDPDTAKITRLRSYYDPRKLLPPAA